MSHTRFVAIVFFALLVAGSTDCGNARKPASNGASRATHEHTPLPGGTPVVLGDDNISSNWSSVRGAGRLTAYVLDGHMENCIRIAATRFARGEGCWFGREAVFFACTNGGPKNKGQMWRYSPSPNEGHSSESRRPDQVELFIEPNDGKLVQGLPNRFIL